LLAVAMIIGFKLGYKGKSRHDAGKWKNQGMTCINAGITNFTG
jgi:hypothetical protein